MSGGRVARRRFLKVALGALAAGPALAAYVAYGEPGLVELRRVEVRIAGLDPALAGLTIALLSDFHVSRESGPELTRRAVALAQADRPDLVALGGDFVSRGGAFVSAAVEAVAPLRAPLGVYAVLGNRDHSSDVAGRLTRLLERAGVDVLRNRSVTLDVRGAPLHLIGVDDVLLGRADPDRAFREVPADGLRLLLVHEPDFADEAARRGVHLQLSGHTHGGQVRLPLVGPLLLPELGRRYPEGLRRVPGTAAQVYTSRGVGTVPPAVRFNCRPEVAILRLTTA